MTGDIKQYYLENKDEIVRKRLNGVWVKDLAKEYGFNERTLRSYLNQDGIKIRKNISDYDVDDIIKDYKDGMSAEDLQHKYCISWCTIKPMLKENDIHLRNRSEQHRIYSINEHYFDDINTPNKAYVFGLLYADGCAYRKDKKYILSISLQEGDKHILEDVKREIEYEGSLTYIDHSDHLEKYHKNTQNQWSLCICNKHIVNTVIDQGIVPRKSYYAKYPNKLDENLFFHFLRGLSDGNGCIAKNEERWELCGTYNLMEGVKDRIESKVGVHCSFYTDKRKKCLWHVRVSGRLQVTKLLNYMYKDAELKLNRKYELYKSKYCK